VKRWCIYVNSAVTCKYKDYVQYIQLRIRTPCAETNTYLFQYDTYWRICFRLQLKGGRHSVGFHRKGYPQSEVQWLRLALSNGPNRVGVAFNSPENKNKSSFRNVAFSSYLEFRTIYKVHTPNNTIVNSTCLLLGTF
jgi:hypothetical protein